MPINMGHEIEPVDASKDAAQPWTQPGLLTATHEAFAHSSNVGTTYEKAPYQAYDLPGHYPQERESIFHPVKAVEDILTAIDRMSARLDLLVNQLLLERTFTDEYAGLGSTVGYVADYKERRYLYALAWSTITLQTPQGTIALTSGKWQNVSVPRGTLITIQGGNDQALQYIVFRHCDVIMN